MDSIENAIRLYYKGEIFEAESVLRNILQEDPDNVKALVRLAIIQTELGRIEEAGSLYLKAAQIYEQEGSYEDSLNTLEKGLPVLDEKLAAPLKGRCLYYLGRFEEALSHFLISPEENQNLLLTAKTYFQLGQYDKSLECLEKMLSVSRSRKEIIHAYYWVGKSLSALGRFDEAVKCFKRHLSIFPGEKQVYLDLAVCYLYSGSLGEARSNLNQYRLSGGDEAAANFYLGIVDFRLGNYIDAIRFFNKAKSNDQALHWKGLAYYELGMYYNALKCFTRAAKYEKKPVYLKMMGNANLKLGSYFEAKICYEKAYSLDPLDADLKKLITLSENLLKTKR